MGQEGHKRWWCTWRCTETVGKRRSQNSDTCDRQRIWNLRAAKGFQRSYIDCIQDEAKNYKMQRPSQISLIIQGGSNITGTVYTCLHTNQSRSYLNHLVYTANKVTRTLKRRIGRKVDVLWHDQLGFRRIQWNMDAIEMLRIISERTLDIGEIVCLLHRLAEEV